MDPRNESGVSRLTVHCSDREIAVWPIAALREKGSNRSLSPPTARGSRSTTGICGREKLRFKVEGLRPPAGLVAPA